jgi:2TM family of unknown function (DUF5676)
MLKIKVCIWSLGTFFAVSFLFCVLWGLVTPGTHYMEQFLEIVLPAFKWLTPMRFCLGLLESFLWGAYIGLLFVPIHNFFYHVWETKR